MPPPSLRLDPNELRALRGGDRLVVERTLVELVPQVHGLLFRMLGRSPHVDDALQEALIELTKAFPSFRGEASLRTLAHRVTTRVAYRYYKKLKLERLVEHEHPEIGAPSRVEERLIARRELAYVYQILDTLSETRRTAFVLCEVEGLSPREAAKAEGVSSLVMRSRLFRAKAEVRAMLKRRNGKGIRPLEAVS